MPPPQPSPKKVNKKRVRFAEPDHDDDQVEDKGDEVVRIKLVLSKQELKDIVQKGGISVREVLSLVQGKGMDGDVDVCTRVNDGSHGWKPALETIPE